ncbi:hypothetical protein ACFQ3P_27230 [Paraburkholderia sabiae]|uniref:hypothetical protein n=1 Tax=Paraburkholderia sabiae TaxID=273251 RepID=UPI00338EC87E
MPMRGIEHAKEMFVMQCRHASADSSVDWHSVAHPSFRAAQEVLRLAGKRVASCVCA